MKRTLYLCAILLVALAATSTGCKKKTTDATTTTPADGAAAPAAAAPAASSEADAVNAALEKKDFDAVVAGLVAMKQTAATPEQQARYVALVDDVKIKLLDEAPTNPKAAEALAILRRITGGR